MTLIIEEKELSKLPISVDESIVSGKPVFSGTRVPVESLLTNLEAGLTLDEFLDRFPTVKREQALQILAFSRATLSKLSQTARHTQVSYDDREKERNHSQGNDGKTRYQRHAYSRRVDPSEIKRRRYGR